MRFATFSVHDQIISHPCRPDDLFACLRSASGGKERRPFDYGLPKSPGSTSTARGELIIDANCL